MTKLSAKNQSDEAQKIFMLHSSLNPTAADEVKRRVEFSFLGNHNPPSPCPLPSLSHDLVLVLRAQTFAMRWDLSRKPTAKRTPRNVGFCDPVLPAGRTAGLARSMSSTTTGY